MTLALYNQIKANFEASAPDIFTAAGQLVAGTGAGTHAAVPAPGASKKALVADSAQSTGLNWAGGVMEIGMIIIWSGSVVGIPSGWQLCDGTNGTPDLRGRFIPGAGSTYAVGDNGGAAIDLQHSHSIPALNNAGAHTHSGGTTGVDVTSHSHNIPNFTTGGPSANVSGDVGTDETVATTAHTHSWSAALSSGNTGHTHTRPTTGSNGDHNHASATSPNALNNGLLPAYYALCFIQRVA